MEVFHDINEPDRCIAQAPCDLRWAPLTRHAVRKEELADLGLMPAVCRPTGSVPQHFSVCAEGNPLGLPRTGSTSDDLRAEVSLLNHQALTSRCSSTWGWNDPTLRLEKRERKWHGMPAGS